MASYSEKIRSLEETREAIRTMRQDGKKIVFTNGCFDILHPGHTRYLHAAKQCGDYLIVAVNSDRSVRSIKGGPRPVMPQQARAELLAALACVDSVLIFDEDNPARVIRHLMPDALVKGGDWKEDEIIGADTVKEAGGVVKRIPFIEGFSTTEIIDRIKSA